MNITIMHKEARGPSGVFRQKTFQEIIAEIDAPTDIKKGQVLELANRYEKWINLLCLDCYENFLAKYNLIEGRDSIGIPAIDRCNIVSQSIRKGLQRQNVKEHKFNEFRFHRALEVLFKEFNNEHKLTLEVLGKIEQRFSEIIME